MERIRTPERVKCPSCNGYGTHQNGSNKGEKCTRCDGTGINKP